MKKEMKKWRNRVLDGLDVYARIDDEETTLVRVGEKLRSFHRSSEILCAILPSSTPFFPRAPDPLPRSFLLELAISRARSHLWPPSPTRCRALGKMPPSPQNFSRCAEEDLRSHVKYILLSNYFGFTIYISILIVMMVLCHGCLLLVFIFLFLLRLVMQCLQSILWLTLPQRIYFVCGGMQMLINFFFSMETTYINLHWKGWFLMIES